MQLGKLDIDLIVELQKDGRQSYTNLADLLHVSEATIRNRCKKLRDNGVIKIMAVPDFQELGYNFIGIVGIEIKLTDWAPVAEQLIEYPNVCYLVNVTGRYDMIAIVVAKSPSEFSDFVHNELIRIHGIVRTETSVCLPTKKGLWANLDTEQLVSSLAL